MSGLDYEQRLEVEQLVEKHTGGHLSIVERFAAVEKRVGILETLDDTAKQHARSIRWLWGAVLVPTLLAIITLSVVLLR